MFEDGCSRKDFLTSLVLGVAAVGMPGIASAALQETSRRPETITLDDLKSFARIAGLSFTDAELNSVLADVRGNPEGYKGIRTIADDYGLFPSSVFRVRGAEKLGPAKLSVKVAPAKLTRPPTDEDIAFLTVAELGHLLRSKQITSVELTQIYLERLKIYGSKLFCVVTLLESRALEHAALMDAEIKQGKFRGLLHGIPCGIKDLFALKGAPTQWGTAAFKGQVIDHDSAVVERLDAAGAIIVAKLSLGALAMNDNWFGGRTLNPWNPKQGSSGSSAGSASAMAAGLVAFAVGTETSGSIVSPSHRCRVTGFRPTFGSISRYGAMALSWTMDKVGPIGRTAEDAMLVLHALIGRDERDASTLARSLVYETPKGLKGMRVGLMGTPNDQAKSILEKAGATFGEFKLPPTDPGLSIIIGCEGAAMFDAITRNGRLSLVTENEWPQIFRGARFTPAVELLQAERARTKLMKAYEEAFEPFDFVLAQGLAGGAIYPMNLVGQPQILVPWGTTPGGTEQSVSLLGKSFEEAKLVGAASILQKANPVFRARPDLSKLISASA